MRRVVSQGWLHASWRPRFTASHLSWTTYPRLQCQAAVKVHGVFPSSHGYSASSPRLQFHRIPRRDSAQVVAPFVQVGTSRHSSVSGGADYPFTLLAQTRENRFSVVPSFPTRVHRPNEFDDLDQTITPSVSSVRCQPAGGREAFEVVPLPRQQRIRLEVRDDPIDQIVEPARLPLEGLVAAVRPDASTPEVGLNDMKHLGSIS